MDVVMYGNVYFLFLVFFFFSNNIGSYDSRSDSTIHDPTYLPRRILILTTLAQSKFRIDWLLRACV